jgi:DNA-binding transcriptional LysR family regulator
MRHRVAGSETSVSETTPLDLVDVRAFCRVVDLASITEAAKAIGETKGSVSRRITRLERSLGVELVRRSPRLVQATEEGQGYRARVGRALELLDEANAEVRHRQASARGHLRVTAPFDLAVGVFAPIVAAFTEKYPEVTVELLLTEAVLDFEAHQIDVALRATSVLGDSSLVAHKLEQLTGGLFASPAYLESAGIPRRPADLSTHRLLLRSATRGEAKLVLRSRRDEEPIKLRVRAAVAASDFAFGREVALAGGGIALLPSIVVRRDVAEGRLQPVLRDLVLLEAGLYLVHPGSRLLPAKVRVFRDHVLRAFRVPRRRPVLDGGAEPSVDASHRRPARGERTGGRRE